METTRTVHRILVKNDDVFVVDFAQRDNFHVVTPMHCLTLARYVFVKIFGDVLREEVPVFLLQISQSGPYQVKAKLHDKQPVTAYHVVIAGFPDCLMLGHIVEHLKRHAPEQAVAVLVAIHYRVVALCHGLPESLLYHQSEQQRTWVDES